MDNRDKARIALWLFPLMGLVIAFIPAETGPPSPSAFDEIWNRDRLMWDAMMEFGQIKSALVIAAIGPISWIWYR